MREGLINVISCALFILLVTSAMLSCKWTQLILKALNVGYALSVTEGQCNLMPSTITNHKSDSATYKSGSNFNKILHNWILHVKITWHANSPPSCRSYIVVVSRVHAASHNQCDSLRNYYVAIILWTNDHRNIISTWPSIQVLNLLHFVLSYDSIKYFHGRTFL